MPQESPVLTSTADVSFRVAPPEFIALPEVNLKPFSGFTPSRRSQSELDNMFIASQSEAFFQAVGSAIVPSGVTALLGMMGDKTTQMTRRDLLKTLGVIAAGSTILAACAPPPAPTPKPIDQKQVSVLLGYNEGYLGLTAVDRSRKLMSGNLPDVWKNADKEVFWEAMKSVVSRDLIPELCEGNLLDCEPSSVTIEYVNGVGAMKEKIARYNHDQADLWANRNVAVTLSGVDKGVWLPRMIAVNFAGVKAATKNMDNSATARLFLEVMSEEVIHNQIELDHILSAAEDQRLKRIFTEIMPAQESKIFQTHDFRYSLGNFPLLVDKSDPNDSIHTIEGLYDFAEAARAYIQRDIIYSGLGLANLQPPTQRSQENEVIAPLFEMVHREFDVSALDFLAAYKRGLLPLVDLYKAKAQSRGFKAEDKDIMIIILRLSAAMKPVEKSSQGPITPQVKAQVATEKKQIQDLIAQMKRRP